MTSLKRKIKAAKPAGKCIFCGGGNMSKEHFWPDWVGDLLPRYPENQREEQHMIFDGKNGLPKERKITSRPGQTWTKTLRVVCAPCNNGWMSVIEKDAKAILMPIIKSQPHKLTLDSLSLLSRWITLKVMVAEQNKPNDAVTSAEDRKKFKDSQTLPSNFVIYIAKCGVDGWESSYMRHTGLVTIPGIYLPQSGRFKNIHSIAFGIGDLFVLVLHTTSKAVFDTLRLTQPEGVLKLYPEEGELDWPPRKSLSAAEATAHAMSLHEFLKGPKVKWEP